MEKTIEELNREILELNRDLLLDNQRVVRQNEQMAQEEHRKKMELFELQRQVILSNLEKEEEERPATQPLSGTGQAELDFTDDMKT